MHHVSSLISFGIIELLFWFFSDDRQPSPTMPFPRDEAPYRPVQSEPDHIPPPVNDMDRDAVGCFYWQVLLIHPSIHAVHHCIDTFLFHLFNHSLQEIFNHVAADIETFIYKVGSALAKDDGTKKKKRKRKMLQNLVSNWHIDTCYFIFT